jgi:hypothetical protein
MERMIAPREMYDVSSGASQHEPSPTVHHREQRERAELIADLHREQV